MPLLQPIDRTPLQAYLTDSLQLFDIVKEVLLQIGVAKLLVTSFSASEEFLRSMARMKKQGFISEAQLVIDHRAALKINRLLPFAENVFDKVILANNHSKVILFETGQYRVSICTSQNQTRGNRHESGIITTNPEVYSVYEKAVTKIIENGINTHGILDRNAQYD